MFVLSFYLLFFLLILFQRQPVWGHIRVHIFDQLIRDVPTLSLGIKTEYTPRTVVRLVNIFNCLAYDWMTRDEWKVTWHDSQTGCWG